jgi:hypothetical protein
MVAVCGTSVPDVGDELEVVECALVEVVALDGVAVVVGPFDEDGLLEQAARARAQAGRISRRIDHVRSTLGTAGVYDGALRKWGFNPNDPALSSG